MGPFPRGLIANHMLAPITAAVRTAKMRTAQPGRYQATIASARSGTAHAATRPTAFQPPGSVKVSPTTNAPKKKVERH